MSEYFFPGVSNENEVELFNLQIYIDYKFNKEKLIITGLINEELIDGIYVSLTLLKKLGLIIPNYLHIHFPNYLNLKVGISSSLCIFLSLYEKIKKVNLFDNKKIIASGEIDLEGNVLEVGGIKEKIKIFNSEYYTFLLSYDNEKDVENDLIDKIYFLNNISELIKDKKI